MGTCYTCTCTCTSTSVYTCTCIYCIYMYVYKCGSQKCGKWLTVTSASSSELYTVYTSTAAEMVQEWTRTRTCTCTLDCYSEETKEREKQTHINVPKSTVRMSLFVQPPTLNFYFWNVGTVSTPPWFYCSNTEEGGTLTVLYGQYHKITLLSTLQPQQLKH